MMVENFFINFILNKVCSQRAMKNSTFASFGNSIIKSQFFNGGKMIKWKVGAVEKCPRWTLVEIVPFSALYYKFQGGHWWKSFPSLRSIINFTLSRFYKSVQVQVQLPLIMIPGNYMNFAVFARMAA